MRKTMAQIAIEQFPNFREARAIMDKATTSKHHWGIEEKDVEEIVDVFNEIEILKEIKDNQDELNILRNAAWLTESHFEIISPCQRPTCPVFRSGNCFNQVLRYS